MRSRSFTLKEYSGFATAFLFINANTNAQVIYTDIDPDIELNLDGQTAGIDMDNNGTIDFAFLKSSATFTTFFVSSDITLYRNAAWVGPFVSSNFVAGTYFQLTESGGIYYIPYAIEFGNLIDENLSFQNNGFQIMASEMRVASGGLFNARGKWWPDVEDHYLGVRFVDVEEFYHYGWIRCTVDSAETIIIKDYAYEANANQPIAAGDTISYVSIGDAQNNLNLNVYSFGSTVYIKINEKLNNKSMHIYNLAGREIYSDALKNQFSEINLDTPKGIYLVEIIADEGRYTKKVYLD